MKTLSLLLTIVLSVPAYTQSLSSTHKWEKVHISSDSVFPLWIGFVDSLNGYLTCYTFQYDPDIPTALLGLRHRLYKTTNGGKQWIVATESPFQPKDSVYVSLNGHFGGNRPYFFPTSQDRYILFYQYDTTIRLRDSVTKETRYRMWYSISHNGGLTWDTPRKDPWGVGVNSTRNNYTLITALGGNDLIFYCDTGVRRNHLFRSVDGGVTIPYKVSDEVFARTIRPDTVGEWGDVEAIFNLETSDTVHWTAVVIRQPIDDVVGDTTEYYKRFPRGLRTLVTSNGGTSWQVYTTHIATEIDMNYPLYGDMQFIKGTPHLFYFSSYAANAEGGLNGNRTRPMLGINFCYSSDYGKTWKIDTTFNTRRRAYEAVTKDELWFTLPKKEIVEMKDVLRNDPAYILTRTTDRGETYAFDTTTLTHFEQQLDGRIITFTDPRHGWIVATSTDSRDLFVFRYDANEQPKGVEDDIFTGGYGRHYTLNPNPAKEFATLSLYKYFYIRDFMVYDILGTQKTIPYRIEGNTIELDVRKLPIGHYMIRINHFYGTSVIPLVVMR